MTAHPRHPFADLIGLISADDLARLWGYAGANNAFRDWCRKMKILPVPGRPGWYDPRLIRQRLDEAQGLTPPTKSAEQASPKLSLVDQRRARNGAL